MTWIRNWYRAGTGTTIVNINSIVNGIYNVKYLGQESNVVKYVSNDVLPISYLAKETLKVKYIGQQSNIIKYVESDSIKVKYVCQT